MPLPPLPKELSNQYKQINSTAELEELARLLKLDIHSIFIYLDRVRSSSEDNVSSIVINNPALQGPIGPPGATGPIGPQGPSGSSSDFDKIVVDSLGNVVSSSLGFVVTGI